MIGCDSCDSWYHFKCVGISVEPRKEEVWICADCRRVKPKKKGDSKVSKAAPVVQTYRSSSDVSSSVPRKPHIKHTPTLNKPPKSSSILSAAASANQGWMCAACGHCKDPTVPMIGCDSCDSWFHWQCVGIQQAPDEKEAWYCGHCASKGLRK